ncbi:hypothetical protein ACJ41O_008986 [Fusarium nematophilum]
MSAVIDDRPQEALSTDTDDEDAQSTGTVSTDAYSEHEPFETFQHKVRRLRRSLWSTYSDEQILIERIKGGANNRIISISVPEISHQAGRKASSIKPKKPKKFSSRPSEYILRVPRWGAQTGKFEIAMVKLLRRHISAGIPTVVSSNMSAGQDNALGTPYVLQLRVPGQRLDDAWPTLTHQQRLMITLELARLCISLKNISNPSGGIPDVIRRRGKHKTLRTTDYPFPGDGEGSERVMEKQPPVAMLCERLSRWTQKYSPDETWTHAAELVQHMQKVNGTFRRGPGGSFYFLSHGDLFPRNIMVQTSGDSIAYITGVLDWDDAHFAPAVVSFSPPAWLWMKGWWKDYDEEGCLEDEDLWRAGYKEPEDQESREIKKLFDSVVGQEYLQFAYSPDAYAARRIWKAAQETIGSSWTQSQLDDLYSEWKTGQGAST